MEFFAPEKFEKTRISHSPTGRREGGGEGGEGGRGGDEEGERGGEEEEEEKEEEEEDAQHHKYHTSDEFHQGIDNKNSLLSKISVDFNFVFTRYA